jgi:hypothetical protein
MRNPATPQHYNSICEIQNSIHTSINLLFNTYSDNST